METIATDTNGPSTIPGLRWLTGSLGMLATLSVQFGARFPYSQFQLDLLTDACIYWALIVLTAGWLCERRNDARRGEIVAVLASWGFVFLIFTGWGTAHPPPTFYPCRP